jgi:zinc transport system ATP-binding protein
MSINATENSVVAIVYKHVTFSYDEGPRAEGGTESRPVLENVSLTVRAGERLGILGPNGGGKSTLLKLTLGLLGNYKGTISICGRTPEESRRAGLIGYVPQHNECELAFPLSVRQVVAMPAVLRLAAWRKPSLSTTAAVERAIHVVGADAFADQPIGHLSGGQRQRAMIARALAFEPKILVLDEPMVGVDIGGQQQFAQLILRLNKELGITIVVVSHDIRAVAAGCDRVACLSRTLHFHDAPRGLTPAVLAEVFRHDVAAVFGDLHVDAHAAATCSDPTHTHPSRPDAPIMPTINVTK